MVVGDLTDAEFCVRAVAGCDAIVHLASVPSDASDASTAISVHEAMARNLLAAAVQARVSRFVHVSTVHVFGKSLHGTINETTRPEPVSPYGRAHLAAEHVLDAFASEHPSIVSLRCANGFGASTAGSDTAWSLVTGDLCLQAARGSVLRLSTHGRHQRDFITLTDIVGAISHFLLDHSMQGLVLLGSGHSVTLRTFAEVVARRAQHVFGRSYGIEVRSNDFTSPVEYSLDVRCLRDCGFVPKNDVESEIDGLLRAATTRCM
jgi:UDP-glucose 4-epimerase